MDGRRPILALGGTGGPGSASWGGITGTLSDQADLQNALNDKLDDSQATAVGLAVLGLANPGAVRWVRINADNTVTALSAADTRTALGLVIGTDVQAFNANLTKRTFGITIDGGGSAITTGVKGYLRFPWAGTITKVTLLADQSGNIVIDIWKDTYANFPPTVADTITAAAKPTLSSAQKYEDSTLTGWTTAVSAGDTFAFNVDSAATLTRVTCIIEVTLS